MLPKDVTPRARYAIAGLAALVPPLCMGLFALMARSAPGAFPLGPTWAAALVLSALIFAALARSPRSPPAARRVEPDTAGSALSLRAHLAHACGFLTLVGLAVFPVWGVASLLGAAGWAWWANRARARAIGRTSARADSTTGMLALTGALLQAASVTARLHRAGALMDWIGVATVASCAAGMVLMIYLAFPDGVVRRP